MIKKSTDKSEKEDLQTVVRPSLIYGLNKQGDIKI